MKYGHFFSSYMETYTQNVYVIFCETIVSPLEMIWVEQFCSEWYIFKSST